MGLFDFSRWGKLNKFLSWGLAVYLIANLTFVIYIWMQVNRPQFHGPRPDGPRPFDHGITQELNLSREQQDKFREIDQAHKKNVDSLVNTILNVKRELAAEIFKKNPDDKFIDEKIRLIGSIQQSIEKEVITHFRKLSEICNDEQREKLSNMFKKITGPPPGPKDRMNQNFPPMPPPGG